MSSLTRSGVRPRNLLGAVAGLVALTLALVGCTSSAAAPSSDSAATRTVTDPTGRAVTMPVEPTAALGFYTTDVDILTTLGIPLAESQPIRGDSGYDSFPTFFPQEALQGVTTFANYPEYNFEKVLEAEPDFILNGLGYDAKTLDRLPEIAPTYSVDASDGQDWQVHFAETAEALGRTAQYQAWVKQYEAAVAEAKGDIAETPAKDWTVAALGYWDNSIQIGCSGVPCRTLQDDLQLSTHPLMDTEDAKLSAEQLGQLRDLDAVFMSVGVGEEGRRQHEELLATLDKIPTWRTLPFVRNDRIFTYEMEMQYGSPSGQAAFLEAVRTALVEGANQ